MAMRNFRGVDMRGTSKPKTRKPEPHVIVEPVVEGAPDGTSAEVLAWVGDDVERAHEALEKELTHKAPRKTLIADLEKLTTSE